MIAPWQLRICITFELPKRTEKFSQFGTKSRIVDTESTKIYCTVVVVVLNPPLFSFFKNLGGKITRKKKTFEIKINILDLFLFHM